MVVPVARTKLTSRERVLAICPGACVVSAWHVGDRYVSIRQGPEPGAPSLSPSEGCEADAWDWAAARLRKPAFRRELRIETPARATRKGRG